MTDRPATTALDFGEDLVLLRWALPPLGLLMAIAGACGWKIGQLQPLAAGVLTVLGLAAAVWSLRVTTRRILFDTRTRQLHVYTRKGGSRRTHQMFRFDQVNDVVLRILDGIRRGTESQLGRELSFQLILVTDAGEFPLSRLAEGSLDDCEAKDFSIWQVLGRDSPGVLLARSYRHAVVRRDRLQSIWLARLLMPQASLEEADARVRRDWPSP